MTNMENNNIVLQNEGRSVIEEDAERDEYIMDLLLKVYMHIF